MVDKEIILTIGALPGGALPGVIGRGALPGGDIIMGAPGRGPAEPGVVGGGPRGAYNIINSI